MKEIVVISGKGGTGKTSIAASFAMIAGSDAIVADCDVDAADMHLLLQPDFEYSDDFNSGEVANIDQNNCTLCGHCIKVCHFDAITLINNHLSIDPVSCEGCGYCARICPSNAIINKKRLAGKWFISNTKNQSFMVHARLGIGAGNSGKLVAKVKNEAKDIAFEERKSYILVDGPPGIGCPVVSSLSGANFVVLVTEPSISGVHDLKRAFELVKKFRINAGCIINKADLNPGKYSEIVQFLEKEKIAHLADLPYDENFTRAMTQGQTIVECGESGIKESLVKSWNKIKTLVEN